MPLDLGINNGDFAEYVLATDDEGSDDEDIETAPTASAEPSTHLYRACLVLVILGIMRFTSVQ